MLGSQSVIVLCSNGFIWANHLALNPLYLPDNEPPGPLYPGLTWFDGDAQALFVYSNQEENWLKFTPSLIEETASPQEMAVDHTYIASGDDLVVLTLPTTALVGDKVYVYGKGAGGWRIAQNAGQIIHFLDSDTTPGTEGYLESTTRYNGVGLMCITADTEWSVIECIGDITVV
jgi:hypothetical protein